MSYGQLKKRLDAGETLILDGATGTELQRRGAKMDPSAWSAPVVLDDPKLLMEIHSDYIRAGSDIVTANTFSALRMLLAPAGYGNKVEEIIRRSVEVAQQARTLAAAGRPVAVAASISHMVPTVEGENRSDPARMPSTAEISDSLNELAQTLLKSGADLIILEMMFHPEQAKLALDAALATGLPVWFGMSARRSKDGRLVTFESEADLPVEPVTSLIPAAGVDVAGCMHTSAEIMLEALKPVRKAFKGPLMAYPDSGYFEMPEWRFVDVITPERLERFYLSWLEAGVQAIGGCCGLSAEHIKAAASARDKFRKAPHKATS
jgi:S-methylmethionine-dependent homocysteine/selenocysteine methylase